MSRKNAKPLEQNQPNNVFNLAQSWKDSTFNDVTLRKPSDSVTDNKYLSYRKKSYAMSRRHYFLGGKFPEIYFTPQEARCMMHFLNGFNDKSTGLAMQLSSRTVNFYCGRMRGKLRSKSRKELIKLIRDTDFVQNAIELVNEK